MIVCKHPDCGYRFGWTKRDGDDNVHISPSEGEFYQIKAVFQTVGAERLYPEHDHKELLGCPKCSRVFISTGEEYV